MVLVVATIAGCGDTAGDKNAPFPTHVPVGSIAVVGSTPITEATFEHWLSIVARSHGGHDAPDPSRAAQATVAFLIKAQWLQQEARAEAANEATIDHLAKGKSASEPLHNGMTHPDAVFQARLDIISEGLRERHNSAYAGVRDQQVAAYYAAHRSMFRGASVRDTLMIVTHSRAAAHSARAALARGEPWAKVVRRYSEDSSALNGGVFPVAWPGAQSASLVRTVFAAPRDRLTGPVKEHPAAQPDAWEYYLFEVTGAHSGSQKPLAQVSGEIAEMLREQASERALQAFEREYEHRWRLRTLCVPTHLVPECRNWSSMGASQRR